MTHHREKQPCRVIEPCPVESSVRKVDKLLYLRGTKVVLPESFGYFVVSFPITAGIEPGILKNSHLVILWVVRRRLRYTITPEARSFAFPLRRIDAAQPVEGYLEAFVIGDFRVPSKLISGF